MTVNGSGGVVGGSAEAAVAAGGGGVVGGGVVGGSADGGSADGGVAAGGGGVVGGGVKVAMGRLPVDDDELAACVSCGLCLPSCPTYRVTGEESASPRGRIAAMRAVHAGAVMDTAFTEFMDLCVQCRACEVACPSAVPFGRLMEGARHALVVETAVPAAVAPGRLRGARPSPGIARPDGVGRRRAASPPRPPCAYRQARPAPVAAAPAPPGGER